MIAITTSSSINVNPLAETVGLFMMPVVLQYPCCWPVRLVK
jgi:hypothetical protein